MKRFSKVSLVLTIFTVALTLAACGNDITITVPQTTAAPAATPTVTSGATTAVAITAASTTQAATTAAATTAVATTVAPTTAVATTAVATTDAPTTEAPQTTEAPVTTAAPTKTTALATTKAVASNAIRQTDWATVIKNDPNLQQETPPDAYYTLYVKEKGGQGLYGAPDLDHIVYVDMDKDGIEEAAIALISGGTAGNTGFLLYRYAQPSPRLIGSEGGYKIGIKAVDGKLVSTTALYTGWEPNCCPSGYETQTYGLMNDSLIVVDKRSDGYAGAQPDTVDQFYAYLNGKDYVNAYKFLSLNFQKANPYQTWVAGFATSQEVNSQSLPDAAPNTVRVNLETIDAGKSGQVNTHYRGTWTLYWNADRKGWLMDTANIQEVDGTPGSTANVIPVFRPLLKTIKDNAFFKVLLPNTTEGANGRPLYASVDNIDSNKMTIRIEFSPDCNGANVCDFGSITEQYAGGDQLPPLTGSKIALANGQTGYYQEAPCGASCGEATLTWEQNGIRYSFGSKAATKDELIKMANSAINNGPV